MKNNLKTCIYLDDVRTPTTTLSGYNPWNVVRNYTEFTEWIADNGVPDLISFDHDLAEEHMNDYFDQLAKIGFQSPSYDLYTEKTGLDCAKFICEIYQNKENKDVEFPRCVVHSHNPVGGDNIKSYINGYKKHIGLEPNCYDQRFPFEIKPENRY